jgi:TolA-binding protein
MKKMKTLHVFLILTIAAAFTACKTQEDIRREKTMENINEKISQTQQSNASSNLRFQNLEEQIAKLSGSIEEVAHNKGQDQKDNLLLKERVVQLEETNKKQNENLKALVEKVNEQSKYLEQVVKTLTEMTEKKKDNKEEIVAEGSKDKAPSVKTAIAKYKAQAYSDAREILTDLLENKKMKKKDKAQALYYMGLIEYKEKKFEEAKVYFSKLYTEIPDSTLNSQALLNLAKSFAQLKSKEEAKQTLEELISRYPKSKEASEAIKLKAKL